jgi:recombination protein RecT
MGTDLVEYMRSETVLKRFGDVLGAGANSYIQSVLIAVADNPGLQTCTAQSIFKAALRAASLGLSCDPAHRQAYLVLRNCKGTKVAVFMPHYNGLYGLAVRTGKYRYINVAPVRKGMVVTQDFVTGLHSVKIGEGFDADLSSAQFWRSKHENIIGFIGAFETTGGFRKTVYMTIAEIHEFASMYSDSYPSEHSPWKDKKKVASMEMKTVLRELLRWADTSGTESRALSVALASDENVVDAEIVEESEISNTDTATGKGDFSDPAVVDASIKAEAEKLATDRAALGL